MASFTHALAIGGLTTIPGRSDDDPKIAAAGFALSGARIAAICVTTDRAPGVVPSLAAALKDSGARRVVMWGHPGRHEAAWRTAGVTNFFYPGCDLLALLGDLLEVERANHG